ncbi:MAG: bifunctional UDP-N-acetylglucosamine diphosphorylase/glucosamine-1-phosphate N-acetyltransferase GlmU [Thermomicrobiales bacterium]
MIITDAYSAAEVREPRVLLAVLAAGGGTRMRSKLPKPLHPVCGVPMLSHVLIAGAAVSPVETVIVVSEASAGLIEQAIAGQATRIAVQPTPKGTADALKVAIDGAEQVDLAISLFADHPLLTGDIVAGLLRGALAAGAKVTVLSCVVDDAAAYGRVARDRDGHVERIVERADDDPAERLGSTEINSGMMVVDVAWARTALARIAPSAATGELYLTEIVAMAVAERRPDEAWPVAAVQAPAEVALGINDRQQLRVAEEVLWERRRREVLASGVSLTGAETIYIDADVEIGPDSVIEPFTILRTGTRIGSDCRVGPHAILDQAVLGDRVTVRASTLTRVRVDDDADVGPYAHLRPGAAIGAGAHIGNYAEIKNATIGAGARVGHFSYVGDARVGANANIGAGVVTANFDGTAKHQTEIGDDAFIGSDTVLRAPVRVGCRAVTGAGSVVTKDVPDDATAVGVPARVIRRGQVPGEAAKGKA